jgi:hypothetical protein
MAHSLAVVTDFFKTRITRNELGLRVRQTSDLEKM